MIFRVVLDTNIIVSALLQPLGPSAQIFLYALSGLIQMCVSGNIYAEYEEVISRPRLKRTDDIIQSTLQVIREKGVWVRPTETVQACSDPDDNIFLECAQAAQADYLVTGNIKDFPTSWAGARIVTPRWLLDNLDSLPAEQNQSPKS
jgi:putative PIN family toxin of toxin-antitoxin system